MYIHGENYPFRRNLCTVYEFQKNIYYIIKICFVQKAQAFSTA